jgi:hypothetical protein
MTSFAGLQIQGQNDQYRREYVLVFQSKILLEVKLRDLGRPHYY